MCVSDRQTFYHGVKTKDIIHGWIQNLYEHVIVINSNSSEAGIGLGGHEIELLEQVNHALNIDLGILHQFVYVSWQRKRVII